MKNPTEKIYPPYRRARSWYRPGGPRLAQLKSSPKKDGCTMSMLLARSVKVETIDELIAAGLAIKKSEVWAAVGRLRSRELRLRMLDGERSRYARPCGLGRCPRSLGRTQRGLIH